MAKTNIEIYIDEAEPDKAVSKSLLLPKTPLKLGGSRIPLTPARRNNSKGKSNAVTPAKSNSKLLISSQPTKLKEADLSSLPEIETFARLQPSISQEISEIQLDELEVPKLACESDDDELEIEMLCLNEIDTATRLQKTLAQEIADISLDSLERPCFDQDEDFVISL